MKQRRLSGLGLLLIWALLIAPTIVLASVPSSTAAQGLLGIVAIVIVVLLKPFATNTLARFALMAVSSVIVMRYWMWRLTDTLPEPGLTPSFVLAIILFVIETYSIMVFFLNTVITADPTQRALPPKVALDKLPTVNVLVPSYNEPPEMLAVTLSAAKNMIYPRDKRVVVLCDDGGTDQRCNSPDPELARKSQERRAELQKLCSDLGVMYSTRARNEHAKAGNMSAALAKLDGDLVVVFDADHVPSRDFLARTVGYFVDDPKLFLVQTPHFFINKDPIERNLGLKCPPENEMFYSMIHRGLDRWGGAFFCGSAAVLRRKALDSVGGFAGETITEDAETALEIHSNGWRSLYLDRAMIAGLQPETFASFIQQRGRWAAGMMQMLMLKNPLFRSGLHFLQRLCYINSMSFWLFPIIRLVYLLAPLTYLFFGVEIFVSTFQDAMVYTLSYMAVSFLIQNALFARYRWPLISEVYEVAQAPYLAMAIFRTILKPRGAKFNVTAKDETLANDYISPIYAPLLVLFALMVAGMVALVTRWIVFPGDRSVLGVVGTWAVINFLLVSLSLRAVAEKQQRRSSPRVEMEAPTTLWWEGSGETPLDGIVLDASTSGARIRVTSGKQGARMVTKGETVQFRPIFSDAPHLERPVKAVVRMITETPSGPVLGLLFLPDQPMEVRETVSFLIFGSSENWLKLREATRAKKGLIAGICYVVWLSLSSLPRTIVDFLKEPDRRRRAAQTAGHQRKAAHLVAFGADFQEDLPSEDPATFKSAAFIGGDPR
ncbi:UDP-forming cellulose synthase catalytic subunit [Pseudorhodobacter sp. MZDSW-24AT]|uniref:UDP-forming cellulose synthase catalytic subunit n=1 Tax=Pseudorhodobacter sp. MZDSW-24AT TaxID=2052957 RepID=UPI000C1F32A6|nr:UDP-forming cellulose synthase catalytic subunit [Pseudorhodobacter sp. MZDSW-24AT]PJF07994.1 cellulose synthase catalytic subunit (UDP-forming) [Pseudorhodobacter sp. MZDSW-24AT]